MPSDGRRKFSRNLKGHLLRLDGTLSARQSKLHHSIRACIALAKMNLPLHILLGLGLSNIGVKSGGPKVGISELGFCSEFSHKIAIFEALRQVHRESG